MKPFVWIISAVIWFPIANAGSEIVWGFDGKECISQSTSMAAWEAHLKINAGPCEIIDTGKGFKAAKCSDGKYYFYSKTKIGCEAAKKLYPK